MKKDNKAIVITSIISGVVLIIALIAMISFDSISSNNKITVEGTASIDVSPDLMSVQFMIETKGKTSAEAKNENNEILEKLVIELIKQGFSEDELKTQGFNVYPNYYPDDRNKQDGYIATHSLKIELSSDKFDKISEVVNAGVNSGAGISYINFELSQELQNQYKAEALKLASEDAKIKADAVASGLGKKAGKLISIQVSDFGYYPWNIYTSKNAASGAGDEVFIEEATMQISPSEQEINVRVSATFKII